MEWINNHFTNFCKVIQKRTGISYYWSKDNSYEFINKIGDIKTAQIIKTFDFSTLYTNLPLDVIYDSLRSLIIKMFVNSKSVAIMVKSNSKRAFWSNGSNYAGYREYTIDKLLEALELILFNSYIQFNGSIFKQILWIPMGSNASPFIADFYLSWCEYCCMTKEVITHHICGLIREGKLYYALCGITYHTLTVFHLELIIGCNAYVCDVVLTPPKPCKILSRKANQVFEFDHLFTLGWIASLRGRIHIRMHAIWWLAWMLRWRWDIITS